MFDIDFDGILCISCYGNNMLSGNRDSYIPMAYKCWKKIEKKINEGMDDIGSHIEHNEIDGWRCEIKEIAPRNSSKSYCVEIVKGDGETVFLDGKLNDGREWFEDRKKCGNSKKKSSPIPNSIKFETVEGARAFQANMRSRFMKNYIYLIKLDMNAPLKFIPFFDKLMTDADYKTYFDFTNEEMEWMLRDVDDYRIKDFVKYEKV